MLLFYLTVDFCHLVHTKLTGKHHHISKLGIELQGFHIGDIQLCAEMHLHPLLTTVGHHRDIAGNDGRYLCLNGRIHDLMHRLDILTIDNRIHGEISLHACLITSGSDFT